MPAPETFVVRIAFAWSGPDTALAELRDCGILRRLGRREYAFTLPLLADVEHGTFAEREDRALWIAHDFLQRALSRAIPAHATIFLLFHLRVRDVRTIDPRRLAPRHAPRRWARNRARARERRRWEGIRRQWPNRARDMAAYRRRLRARGRRRG